MPTSNKTKQVCTVLNREDIKTIDLFAIRNNRTRSKMIEKILVDFIAKQSNRKLEPLPPKRKTILTKNTVKIPSDIRGKIDLIAQKQAQSRNQVINDILIEYFEGIE